jgi:hypothetical protein
MFGGYLREKNQRLEKNSSLLDNLFYPACHTSPVLLSGKKIEYTPHNKKQDSCYNEVKKEIDQDFPFHSL